MTVRFGRSGTAAMGLLLVVLVSTGCSTAPGFQRVQPEQIVLAPEEIPEDQLLDVGLTVTEVPELSEKKLAKLGTDDDIRTCERQYIPFHMKSTLQSSGFWGAVQVVPSAEESVDLTVMTELLDSNGETMQLRVQVVDAQGRTWFERRYQENAEDVDYAGTAMGEHEIYQDLYNTVANDLAEFRNGLLPEEIEEIRTVSKLKFAQEFAPQAFEGYLGVDAQGMLVIERLPADDDPNMLRIEKIRERDAMFMDTMNQYYEGLYQEMWPSYEDWRRYNRQELMALRQVERDAFLRTVGGILLIAGAIALQTGDISADVGALSGIMILAGGEVMMSGINVSQQADIHAGAIEELSASFNADMQPTIVEFEGKRYELIGTAEEQYHRWKEILQEIYREEIGFDDDFETSGEMMPRGP